MKNLNMLVCVMLLALLISMCGKEDKRLYEPPEGSINLTDLQTRHDYYLPFGLINNKAQIKEAVLNNEKINFSEGEYIEFKENGFYELILSYKDSQIVNDTFLFTTITEEREFSEWGIRAWVPTRTQAVQLGTENVEIYYPHNYTDLIKVPFIFYVKESGSVKPLFCEGKYLSDGEIFNLKRGIGSVNLVSSELSGQVNFTIGGKQLNLTLNKMTGTDLELHGSISTDTEIPANSLVRITDNIDITQTGSLTVNEGSVILVNEGVDINLDGPLVFSGTGENPVFITCSSSSSYWGGFITRTSGGSVNASYTIFCQSGYHDSENYQWGHSGRQALFYTENSTLSLDHCFMLDHIGQIFYPQNSILTLDNILVQRAQTGGQINESHIILRNSVFTDFPDDSDEFIDADNDALYLSASDAEISNTTFMFAKDDGLDSGNEEGGTINVDNCRFEACFHEGAALSSGDNAIKNHTFTKCVFINCGQGLELGFSSQNHTVIADNCMFLNNGIGIRYGDNYDWSRVEGKMIIKNSYSLNNDRDVWNMVRRNWSPVLENLILENTIVSKLCPQYPGLTIEGN
jgi:hypothetical protein